MLLSAASAGAQVAPWATTFAPAVDARPLAEDRGADGLAQTLRKLRTWGSLLMIVAHPDDEDGGMMAFASRGAGVRTTLLTLTRGEGGQNAISGDVYDALGLIRTNELLAADRYSGTEQLWGTEADYGFSKTKEEAFAQWGRERVLRDVVRAVREVRPLVLTSVFVGGVTDGHGHHQVAGEMAQEAFKLAGDPSVFPDQIAAGLRPWRPLAVFARTPFAPVTAKGMYDYATDTWAPVSFLNYVTGERSSTAPGADVVIPEGRWDPVLGRSYLQMAREGWGLQKSQNGGGNPPLAGPDDVGYHRYGSRVPVPAQVSAQAGGFFAGIDTSLPGMVTLARGADAEFVRAGLERVDRAVTRAAAGYAPGAPERIVPDLLEGYRAAAALMDAVAASRLSPDSKADLRHELGIKEVQFNTALVEALGLHLDALAAPGGGSKLGLYPEESRDHVTPGETFGVRLRVSAAEPWSAGGAGLRFVRTGLETEDPHWEVEQTSGAGLGTAEASAGDAVFRVGVPRGAAPTAPYFTRPSIEQAYYDLSDPKLAGRSFGPYPASGYAEWSYDGVPVRLSEVVQAEERERGRGDFEEPLVVEPGLSVGMGERVAVLPSGRRELPVEVAVRNDGSAEAEAVVALEAPAGWRVAPSQAAMRLGAGERGTERFTVTVPEGAGTAVLKATARSGQSVYASGFVTAGYPGLRSYNLYRAATLEVRPVAVRVAPGVRVGYVMGTGDQVPAALQALGVPVDLLTPGELLTRDLRGYSTLMLGVRTYTAAPLLAEASGVLRRFAEAGGTVVVQYQSGDFPGAPDGLRLDSATGTPPAKVVDERSGVELLEPDDALLRMPNRITGADFEGWVEERGHGFAASWGPQWTALVEMHDAGQAAQRGGLLVDRVGRGRYVYLALALYRQLPEGVAGAYRLLANLVSGGRE